MPRRKSNNVNAGASCRMCQRTFANANALKQHMASASHAGANAQPSRNNRLQVTSAGGSIPRPVPNRNTALGKAVNGPRLAELVYNQLGSTDEGREFALTNLHPCGEYVVNSPGIPDETQSVATTPTFRGDNVIYFNSQLFSTPPTPTADFRFDVQVVVTPHPEIDYAYRLRYNGTWSRWEFKRTSYFSANPDGTATTLETSGYSKTRLCGRGITIHLDAPRLADQGRLIAGQVEPIVHINDITIPSSSSISTTARQFLEYYPLSEQELTAQDPLTAQWNARDGCYIPARYLQPYQEYVSCNTGRTLTEKNDDDTTHDVPYTYLSFTAAASDRESTDEFAVYHPFTPTWTTGLVDSPTGCTWGVSEPLNMLAPVIFFLGIDSRANLHVKTRLHLECTVQADKSAVTPFTHKSPTLDRVALDVVTRVAQNQQHVFFARDNDLSGILQSVGKVLTGVLGPLGSALESTGIPIISQVGNLARRAGAGVNTFMAG